MSNTGFNPRIYDNSLGSKLMRLPAILARMPIAQGVVCLMAIPVFSYFLLRGRLTSLVENILSVLSGKADALALLSDGLGLLLMVMAVFFLVSHVIMYDRVPPQKSNHPALKNVVLPHNVHTTYLPFKERIKAVEQGDSLSRDVESNTDHVANLLGFNPALFDKFDTHVSNDSTTSESPESAAQARLVKELAAVLSNGPLEEGIDITDPNLIEAIAKELGLQEETQTKQQ